MMLIRSLLNVKTIDEVPYGTACLLFLLKSLLYLISPWRVTVMRVCGWIGGYWIVVSHHRFRLLVIDALLI